MPDQNGNNNQSPKPENPFKPKSSQGGHGNGNNHGQNGVQKPQNPFGNQEKPRHQNQQKHQNQLKPHNQPGSQGQPKHQESSKPQDHQKPQDQPKVAPINPFASEAHKAQNPFSSIGTERPKEEPKKEEKVIEAEVVEKRTGGESVKVGAEPVKKVAESPRKTDVEAIKKEPSPYATAPVAEIKKAIPGDEPDYKESDIDDFKNQVMDILDQAGITKGTLIKTVIIVAAAVFLILAYVYGWYGVVVNIFNRTSVPENGNTVEQVEQAHQAEIPSNVSYNANSPFGLISAYIFGLEFNQPNVPIQAVPIGTWGTDAGIKAANVFGMVMNEMEVRFVDYVALLRKLQNIYDTDVYALLDMSTDRRVALEQHMRDLAVLLEEAADAYADIDVQLQLFEQQYAPIVQNKDLYEANFFNALYAYYGEVAYLNLGMFIKSYQDAVAVKAYFNSYRTLQELLVAYVNALRPRYSDISANTEALIKGIRVFYVPKSDIKTIIKLGE